jgi:hypothetical protein
MPVDERSRHALYLRLEDVLGREEATTLMESLPPSGGPRSPTNPDLEHVAEVNRREHEALEHRLMASSGRSSPPRPGPSPSPSWARSSPPPGVAVALARALYPFGALPAGGIIAR